MIVISQECQTLHLQSVSSITLKQKMNKDNSEHVNMKGCNASVTRKTLCKANSFAMCRVCRTCSSASQASCLQRSYSQIEDTERDFAYPMYFTQFCVTWKFVTCIFLHVLLCICQSGLRSLESRRQNSQKEQDHQVKVQIGQKFVRKSVSDFIQTFQHISHAIKQPY